MRRSRPGGIVLTVAVCALACGGEREPPRLTVVVVVDQMRADYMDRFADGFTGGLGWLANSGARFTDAHQDHARTETAVGHATLATGVFPSRHGIVGNSFYNRLAESRQYSVGDSTSPIVGFADDAGMSPANLLTTTIGDWLKEVSPASKTHSIAIKDRSAITMGGKHPDDVYWYHYATGRWITSTYYRTAYPDWVAAFNDAGHANAYFGREWTLSRSEDAYAESREDAFPNEADGTNTTFPHLMGQTDGDPNRRFFAGLPNSPFGAELTLAFARELIINEGVGTDATPDMLFLGLSSADYVGHDYGPYSREVQDYYLQLDHYLGEFFSFLDEHVGAGQYVVALSADHGVLPIPEELIRRGVDAGRHDLRPLYREIRQVGQAAAESGELPTQPELVSSGGIALRFSDGAPLPEQLEAFRQRLADLIRSEPDIAQVYTYDELLDGAGSGKMIGRHQRSFHPDRSADVIFHLNENYLSGSTPRRTSHGSPWDYDTNVPLIFAGPGIIPGEHGEYTRTVDMAPTLARLLGITPPDSLDGRVLPVGPSLAGTR
jgi:predicted AlkP superfamily pyrophosphatase or phosphodiesterase